MSDPKRTAVQQLDALIDAYLKDLLELPDDAFVSDARHAVEQSSVFSELVKNAAAEAGRRRLAQAKRELANRARVAQLNQPVDLAEARRYLAEAANDNRITLAARELRELPDEEVCRLYLQLKQLEAQARNGKRD